MRQVCLPEDDMEYRRRCLWEQHRRFLSPHAEKRSAMITSTGNGRIRELVRLKKNAKDRAERGVFLVEGPKMFREIPAALLQETYVAESFRKSAEGRKILAETLPAGVRFDIVSDPVFQYVSDTRSPQGILVVVKQLQYQTADLLGNHTSPQTGKSPLIITLENLQDPGNLGTVLRTAEAAGATGILLSDGCADIYSPKVTRSTMGSVFRVPFVCSHHFYEDLLYLKKVGVKLYAAHLNGSTDMYAESYAGPCAFLIGNESRGLTEEAVSLADQAVRIPMSGKVESLNAAVAASVMLYEAKRQRAQRK